MGSLAQVKSIDFIDNLLNAMIYDFGWFATNSRETAQGESNILRFGKFV